MPKLHFNYLWKQLNTSSSKSMRSMYGQFSPTSLLACLPWTITRGTLPTPKNFGTHTHTKRTSGSALFFLSNKRSQSLRISRNPPISQRNNPSLSRAQTLRKNLLPLSRRRENRRRTTPSEQMKMRKLKIMKEHLTYQILTKYWYQVI